MTALEAFRSRIRHRAGTAPDLLRACDRARSAVPRRDTKLRCRGFGVPVVEPNIGDAEPAGRPTRSGDCRRRLAPGDNPKGGVELLSFDTRVSHGIRAAADEHLAGHDAGRLVPRPHAELHRLVMPVDSRVSNRLRARSRATLCGDSCSRLIPIIDAQAVEIGRPDLARVGDSECATRRRPAQ